MLWSARGMMRGCTIVDVDAVIGVDAVAGKVSFKSRVPLEQSG
jgi:hypothetical protein